MTKKHFRGWPAVLLVVGLTMILGGCGPSETGVEETAPEAASAQPDKIIVHTRQDPGAYGGKEDSHIPVISTARTEAGLRVTVSVSHEMNPEKPHFIMWIRLWDGEGRLLGEKDLQATDDKAEAVFELDFTPKVLKAYEMCNLHGIWMEELEIL